MSPPHKIYDFNQEHDFKLSINNLVHVIHGKIADLNLMKNAASIVFLPRGTELRNLTNNYFSLV